MVGHDAIDLFGHAAGKAPQTGLYVVDRNVQFRRGERAGKRGVGIPENEHAIGALLLEHGFKLLEHAPGLGAMAGGPDTQVVIGSRYLQFLKEYGRHLGIVMLTGMDQDFSGHRAQRPAHHGGFDELGTRADDRADFHAGLVCIPWRHHWKFSYLTASGYRIQTQLRPLTYRT